VTLPCCLRGRPPHLTFPMYARSQIVSVIFSVVLAKVAKTPSSASQPRRSESDEPHLRVLVCVWFLVRGISAVLRLCVELSQCAMNCSSLIFDEERLATAQSQNEMIRNLNEHSNIIRACVRLTVVCFARGRVASAATQLHRCCLARRCPHPSLSGKSSRNHEARAPSSIADSAITCL
jgi:hypothetical protein